jgi:flagellin
MPDGVGDIPYAGVPDPDEVPRGLNLMTLAGAQAALTTIVHATDIISTARGMIGAATNTLGHMRGNVTTTHENLTASESQIRDADMAAGMIAFTKHNILMQAAQAMLAQANQQPQGILQLLR